MYPQLQWLSSKVPNYSIVGANNYDDNYLAHSSEDSILPENYEQTK
jgi:hypothetical protein